MARPKKYRNQAERQAAYRARSVTETGPESNETGDNVTETAPESDVMAELEQVSRDETPGFMAFRPQTKVPFELFDGYGRGIVRTHTDGKQYVMVSRHVGGEELEVGVVTAEDWRVRLDQVCRHGYQGWACHRC